jgi:hypothetical protein
MLGIDGACIRVFTTCRDLPAYMADETIVEFHINIVRYVLYAV